MFKYSFIIALVLMIGGGLMACTSWLPVYVAGCFTGGVILGILWDHRETKKALRDLANRQFEKQPHV
jgi:hypothetical protein